MRKRLWFFTLGLILIASAVIAYGAFAFNKTHVITPSHIAGNSTVRVLSAKEINDAINAQVTIYFQGDKDAAKRALEGEITLLQKPEVTDKVRLLYGWIAYCRLYAYALRTADEDLSELAYTQAFQIYKLRQERSGNTPEENDAAVRAFDRSACLKWAEDFDRSQGTPNYAKSIPKQTGTGTILGQDSTEVNQTP